MSQQATPIDTALGCGCIIFIVLMLGSCAMTCIPPAPRYQYDYTDYHDHTNNVPSPEELYDQLCRNRLALQQDIQSEIDEYRKIGMQVLNLREEVKKNIGNRPLPVVIQMFQRKEVPQDLRLAYSYWNGLVNAEAMQSIIKNLLDHYQEERTLEAMDNEIEFLDRERKLAAHGMIDENRIAAIENMIGLRLDETKRFTKGLTEQEIIERQIRESRNW